MPTTAAVSAEAPDGAGARLWPGVLGLVACLLAALIGFCVLNPDWMAQYRFATPIWVTGTALFALCLVWALGSGAVPRQGVVVLAAIAALSVFYTGTLFRPALSTFRADPTVPLCVVANRYGRLFNTYADRLGISDAAVRSGAARPTLALPDIGGTLLTTRLQVIDTAGLTDRTIAEARKRGDLHAIGDYLFDRVKPTFIHFHGVWGRGIAGDPRLGRDYEEITPGDYVRREALPDQDALQRLRTAYRTSRQDLSSCGDKLSPGSTLG